MLLLLLLIFGGAFRYVVNARGCSFDLLGYHMTTHLLMLNSMFFQLEYCLSLLSWGCMCFMLSVRMARSSA